MIAVKPTQAQVNFQEVEGFKSLCRMRDNSVGYISIESPVYKIQTDDLPAWINKKGPFLTHKNLKGQAWVVSHQETGSQVPGMQAASRKKAVEKFIRFANQITPDQFDDSVRRLEKIVKAGGAWPEWKN